MSKKTDLIKTERLVFRGIVESDANEIVSWRSKQEVYKYFKSPHMLTFEEHLNWYRNNYLTDENRYDWMCIEKNSGNKIGVFGLLKKDDVAEVNYLLIPEAQHKGYASEGLEALIQYAVDKWDVNSIIAEIHKENVESIALIKKLGFGLRTNYGNFVTYGIET